MPRGGAREGAGRPKGAINKVSAEQRAELAKTGELPLDYMLRVMRDPTYDHERRDKMAVGAAPYVHPKLAAIEHTGKDGEALVPQTDSRELAKSIVAVLAAAVTDKDPQQD